MENREKTAFPSDKHTYTDGGLTKREYFAGLAMQALITNVNLSLDAVAKLSIEMSDKILAELDKQKTI